MYALKNVTLKLEGPKLIQVLGPNGAGKTTLLKAVAGMLEASSGRVLVCGLDVAKDYKRVSALVSYMPQTNKPPPLTPLTVAELAEVFSRGSSREVVAEYLEKVGLPRRAWEARLSELSGGSFQRALLAAVLASRAPIILLDEPLASVDPEGRAQIAELLGEESRRRLVVVTSHDPHPLLEQTKMVVLLNKIVVAAGDPEEVLLKAHPKTLYAYWVSDHECCSR
ncbi:MAG: ATP-binding cassette domain-containing protein [Acidilobaceae archaeon]